MSTVVAFPAPDQAKWAERITAAWQSSAEGIFEAGRLLIEAKADLQHGEFERMVDDDLPFTASTAQRLMKIASDPRLANPAHVQLLPPHWGTLYEITKLPDVEFEQKIADGTINPGMERKALAPPKAKAGPKKPAASIVSPSRPARGRAAICSRVKDAIAALSGLPPPAEVVGFLTGTDEGVIVGENLPAAIRWLAEFADLWPQEADNAEAE